MRHFFLNRLSQQVLVPESGGNYNLALSDGGVLPVVAEDGGGGGTVTAVTATAPVTSSGGATPNIAIAPGTVGQVLTTLAGPTTGWAPASGGALGSMKRTLFVDGEAAGVTTPNGAAAVGGATGGPFATIAAAMAAIGVSTSAADAEAAYVLELSPTAAGYSEDVVTPGYRCIVLKGTGGLGNQTTILGNVTITMAAGGGAVVGSFQEVTLDNVFLIGNLIIVVDGTSPEPFVNIVNNSVVTGAVTTSAGHGVGQLFYQGDGELAGAVDVPTSPVLLEGAVTIGGLLTCASLQAQGQCVLQGGLACSGTANVYVTSANVVAGANSLATSGNGNTWSNCPFGATTFPGHVGATTEFFGCPFNGTAFTHGMLTFRACEFATPPVFANNEDLILFFDRTSLESLIQSGYGPFPGNVTVQLIGASGTAFPSAAVVGDVFLRSDLNALFAFSDENEGQGGDEQGWTSAGQVGFVQTTDALPTSIANLVPGTAPTLLCVAAIQCNQSGRVVIGGILQIEASAPDAPTISIRTLDTGATLPTTTGGANIQNATSQAGAFIVSTTTGTPVVPTPDPSTGTAAFQGTVGTEGVTGDNLCTVPLRAQFGAGAIGDWLLIGIYGASTNDATQWNVNIVLDMTEKPN
ncbi:MAG TPA: hypothetical protein VFE26_10930 [Trebonia sp.]|jgi:hypothetical protein|nr:hypothetical protein [Trebonia sp.]